MTDLSKPKPNNKSELLNGFNYEMYNLDLMRKVFPRILSDLEAQFPRQQRKKQFRDLIPLYFYLLSYVDGKHTREDGTASRRFGAAFPSREKIHADLRIDHRRIKLLADILEKNGLLLETRDEWERMRRMKWYFVSFCPHISDDGYVIDANGERIIPDYSSLDLDG
ncbi:hypothetical protein [Shouchella miscanthi]|uniref:Uncharacterized protein n=1 Tax=Shouchella miscanthi TaxID=2598861 RepID=A0ABU6NH10_9BACI|nr:hypothetical protein [Shouchella miscanthi]